MNAFERFRRDFQDKRVLIMGLGLLERGAHVAEVFSRMGCRLLITDLKSRKELAVALRKLKTGDITLRLGEHRIEDLGSADVVIRNPGIPWHHKMLAAARRRGIPVCMDSSLFARYFPGTIVAITGTRGKTTTTMMTYGILKANRKRPVLLGGNASRKANISLLSGSTAETIAVMELSSWELQGWRTEEKSPHIAVVTNIYEDHLNRYPSMEEYVADKEAIFGFQKYEDQLLLNRDNAWTRNMAAKARSTVSWFSGKDLPAGWTLLVPGDHNRENAAAAMAVGRLFRLKVLKIRSSLTHFPGVEHRLETVATINGVRFVNDSTATTPEATINALTAVQVPPILLVGGMSKRLALDRLAQSIGQHAKAVVLLKGDGTPMLKKKLSTKKSLPILAEGLEFARSVKIAASHAREGDVVLLSPAFTSFAEFSNEFERGEYFKMVVGGLQNESAGRQGGE